MTDTDLSGPSGLDSGAGSPEDGGGAPEPTLRDTIANAIADQRDAAEAKAQGRPAPPPRQTPAPPERIAPTKGPDGRFVKGSGPRIGRPGAPGAQAAPRPQPGQQPAQGQLQPGQQGQPGQQQAPQPPPGWSPASKAAFAALPEPVKADIAKREAEVWHGLARLQEFRGVDRFADAARQSGTTLENALIAYTSIENLLRRDPAQGFIELLKNFNMQPGVILTEVVRRLGGQPQAAQAGGNMQNVPPAVLQQLNALTEYVNTSIRERDQGNLAQAQKEVRDFWSDPKHPYAENVAHIMVDIINLAKARNEPIDLEKIYESACYAHPEVRELLISQQLSGRSASEAGKAAATSARAAARATVGAPAAGYSAQSAPNPNASLRDTIRAAIDQQRGAL